MRNLYILFFCKIFFCQSISCQVDLENGLLAYYPFDSNYEDATPHLNHGFSSSAPEYVIDYKGEQNKAIHFDGISNFLEISSADQINFKINEEFAISLWVKYENQKFLLGIQNDILSKWSPSDYVPYPYAIRVYNSTSDKPGTIWVGRYNTVDCQSSAKVEGTASLADELWHHIVFQKNGDLLYLYIDGIQQGSVLDLDQCSTENESSLLLAKRTNDTNFQSKIFTGSIDELRFYNRPLNINEIKSLFNSQPAVTAEYRAEILVYPNPIRVKDRLNISGLRMTMPASIRLLAIDGSSIYLKQDFSIPEHLSPGIYQVEIEMPDGSFTSSKIVVVR